MKQTQASMGLLRRDNLGLEFVTPEVTSISDWHFILYMLRIILFWYTRVSGVVCPHTHTHLAYQYAMPT
jgi:hypothetical protein